MGGACIVGAYSIGMLGSHDRYPLRIEYEIAKACIDGGDARLSRNVYIAKQERCLCALEETMKKISYDKYENSNEEFTSTFREFGVKCKSKGRP